MNGNISFSLESWSNTTTVLIRADGVVILDGKELPKDFTAKFPKKGYDDYKEILALANFMNVKKYYPESNPKKFEEFSRIYY